jgi:EmrB/QacA subfamily drug resistance transporter
VAGRNAGRPAGTARPPSAGPTAHPALPRKGKAGWYTLHTLGVGRSPWAALVVLCMGLFLTLLDVTVVNIGVPSIAGGLHASLDQVLWVLNAYTMALAVLLITAGRLGDLVGPRTLYLVGIALFTAASAACGLAEDPAQLIAGRALQGVGAALLTPQPTALVLTLFPEDRRGAAFGVNGVVAGVAALSGPTLGGLIVAHWGWRWVFFVNVPVGLLAMVLTVLLVPGHRPHRRPGLDLGGVALATAALAAITFGLVEGQRYDWGVVWGPLSIPVVIGAGLLLALAFLERQHARREAGRDALIPFALFRDRDFSLMNGVGAAVQFCLVGLFLPFSIYLQAVLGLSPLQAGLVLVPSSLASMAAAPLAGRLADRHGGRPVLVVGLVVFAAGIALLDWNARPGSTGWSFLPAMLLAGVGSGAVFVPLLHVAMRGVPGPLAGAASGALNTSRQLGSVIGGATAGALLQARLAGAVPHQAALYTCLLPLDYRQLIVQGYRDTARGGALLLGGTGTGGASGLPFALPEDVRSQLTRLGHDVFTHAYVDALGPTLALSVVVLVLAAVVCLAAGRRPGPPRPPGRPRRRWRRRALAGLGLLAAAACGLPAGPGGDRPAVGYGSDRPPVTIRFWYLRDGVEPEAAMARQVAAFRRMHPNVRVVARPLDRATALARLRAAGAGGPAPDVSELATTWVGELTKAGALEPYTVAELDAAGSRDAFVQASLGSAGLVATRTTTALPWLVDTPAVYYRADVLRSLGLDPAAAFRDWDSLEATLARVRAAGGIPALGVSGQDQAALVAGVAPWVWGAGGDVLSEDGSSATIAADAALAGLDRYQALVARYGDLRLLARTPAAVEALFAQGRLAVTFAGPALARSLRAAGGPDFGTAPFPAGPQGEAAYVAGGDLSIWRNSPHQAAAYEWVRWLTGTEGQRTYPADTGLLPARAEVAQAAGVAGDPYLGQFVRQLDAGRSFPSTPAWEPVEAALAVRLGSLWASVAETGAPLSRTRLATLMGEAAHDAEAAIRRSSRVPISFACTSDELPGLA